MIRKICSAVALTALVGCGGSAASAPVAMNASHAIAPEPIAGSIANADGPMTEVAAASTEALAADTSALPAPPWADAPLATNVVPAMLLSAWERAENREWCAPIAPRSFGAAAGARARTSQLEGGWAVEFDLRGLPGVGRDGAACDHCGRGVFGIAGTSMTPEEIVSPESDAVLPAPSFRDGSHAEVEVSEAEHVAAATITVTGQGCVYQVWSFLGRDHVEQLVRDMRLVDLPASRQGGALARASD